LKKLEYCQQLFKYNMVRVILLFAVLCAGVSGNRHGLREMPDLKFSTISKGDSSGVKDEVFKVFSSNATWETFWTSHTSGSYPVRAAPKIDFGRNFVIAAFRGTFRSGGYGVEITKVQETRDSLVVYVETRDPRPGSTVAMALTQPFHLVRCERSSKPVKFVFEKYKPPRPSKYTLMVTFEEYVDAADVLNNVNGLNFVISVRLFGMKYKIGIVTVDAALVQGKDAAKKIIQQVAGIEYVS